VGPQADQGETKWIWDCAAEVIISAAAADRHGGARNLRAEGCDITFSRATRRASMRPSTSEKARGKVIGDAFDMNEGRLFSVAARGRRTSSAAATCLSTTRARRRGRNEDWDMSFRLDMMGAVTGCQSWNPSSRNPARQLILMSRRGQSNLHLPQAFNAIKAAIITYAKQLSQCGAEQIRVNTCARPIAYPCGYWATLREAMPELYDMTLSEMRWPLGAPEDVARAMVFLSSRPRRFMSGTNLVIDGGTRSAAVLTRGAHAQQETVMSSTTRSGRFRGS